MKLTLVSNENEIARILNEGDITQMDFRAGTDLVEKLLGEDGYSCKVLLSLEQTPFIDSAGFGWLMMCHKNFRNNGGKLVIHSIPPTIAQVLKLMGMSDILNLAADATEAEAVARGEKK
jgi:anti-anti-sigma factor